MKSAGFFVFVFSIAIAGLGLVLSDPRKDLFLTYTYPIKAQYSLLFYRKLVSDKKLILDFINETLLSKHGVVKGKFADGKFQVQQHRLLSWNRERIHPIIPAY